MVDYRGRFYDKAQQRPHLYKIENIGKLAIEKYHVETPIVAPGGTYRQVQA